MLIGIFKFLLVMIILVAMVLILLGINYLFSGNLHSDEKETDKFRKEVEHDEDVMSTKNVFHQFIDGKR